MEINLNSQDQVFSNERMGPHEDSKMNPISDGQPGYLRERCVIIQTGKSLPQSTFNSIKMPPPRPAHSYKNESLVLVPLFPETERKRIQNLETPDKLEEDENTTSSSVTLFPPQQTYDPYDMRENLERKIRADAEKLIEQQTHPAAFVKQVIDYDTIGMAGLGIIASFLRSKKGLDGLYVCKSMEAFQQKLEEISYLEGNTRMAFVLSDRFETDGEPDQKEYGANTMHKIAICVEKSGTTIKIAILDSLGIDDNRISPWKVVSPAMALKKWGISGIESILWYIYHSALNWGNLVIHYSPIERQKSGFGCETFALRDGVSFLQDPQFFDKIQSQGVTFRELGNELKLRKIKTLPAEFMKGAQSYKLIERYLKQYPLKTSDKSEDSDPKKLQEIDALKRCLTKHATEVKDRNIQNCYIHERSHKYHLLVLNSLESMSTEQLCNLIAETVLTALRPPYIEGQIPKTLSDLHNWDSEITIEYEGEQGKQRVNDSEDILRTIGGPNNPSIPVWQTEAKN